MNARSYLISEIATKNIVETKFSAPETEKPKRNIKSTNHTLICYEVDNEKFLAVSENLNTKEPKEIGLKTYEYYCNNEISL